MKRILTTTKKVRIVNFIKTIFSAVHGMAKSARNVRTPRTMSHQRIFFFCGSIFIMRALSSKASGEVAVHAEHTEALREVVVDQPVVKVLTDGPPVFVASAVDVVHCQELDVILAAARADRTTIGLEDRISFLPHQVLLVVGVSIPPRLDAIRMALAAQVVVVFCPTALRAIKLENSLLTR
jgi:hypothetical protein